MTDCFDSYCTLREDKNLHELFLIDAAFFVNTEGNIDLKHNWH